MTITAHPDSAATFPASGTFLDATGGPAPEVTFTPVDSDGHPIPDLPAIVAVPDADGRVDVELPIASADVAGIAVEVDGRSGHVLAPGVPPPDGVDLDDTIPAVAAPPAPPGVTLEGLSAQVAALTARVAALEKHR